MIVEKHVSTAGLQQKVFLLYLSSRGIVQSVLHRTIPDSSKPALIRLLVVVTVTMHGSLSSAVHAHDVLGSDRIDPGAELRSANPTLNDTLSQEPVEGPSLAAPMSSTDLEYRLPTLSDPPAPARGGIEKLPAGDGDTLKRLPATIQNLWSTDLDTDIKIDGPGTEPPTRDEQRHHETPVQPLDPPDQPLPPVFMPPSDNGSVESVESASTDPSPSPPQAQVALPRAYRPPTVVVDLEPIPWSSWWRSSVGHTSLLNTPTTPVSLQQLMNLSVRNSPVVELAQLGGVADCSAARSKVDEMLLGVAQHYWQTYQWRVIVMVRQRLYHDAEEVRDQVKNLIGGLDSQLMVRVESEARQRWASLGDAQLALRKAQNRLVGAVSLPRWEQELELLPQDGPFRGPCRLNEAAELRNAFARRPELQGAMRRIQAASYQHPVARNRVVPALRPAFRNPIGVCSDTTPIPAQYFMSPEIESICDRIKLDVKNAIIRLTGSYEAMRRYAEAAHPAAREVATLRSRWGDLSGSDRDLPGYFRDLLEAQARLADIEQHFITAQTSYSTAILELRRANGTIIDHCSYRVAGAGAPSPTAQPDTLPSAAQPNHGGASATPTLEAPARALPNAKPQPASESILQAPRERLELEPQPVQAPSQRVPSSPRPRDLIPRGLGSPMPDHIPDQTRPTSQPAAPQSPYADRVPSGEMPMPRGAVMIPGGGAGDSNHFLPPPTGALDRRQTFSPADWGRAAPVVPPPQPQRQQHASPWGRLPAGELPMPTGERLIPADPALQLWHSNG